MKKITTLLRQQSLLLLMLFATSLTWGQSIWTNPITDSAPSSLNPFTTGDIKDANITVSGIGMAGLASNAGANAYNVKGWPNSESISTDAYFTFTLTPNNGYSINFTDFEFSRQRSGTGPLTWAVRSSLDGFTNNIGATFSPGTSSATTTISLTDAVYQNITAAVTFRVYGWAASSAQGTGRISDFTFNGLVMPLVREAPVATPATLISTTGFTANWNIVAGATGYRLDVSTNPDFTAILENYENIAVSGISHIVSTGIVANAVYYYRVRAEFGEETTESSNIITLETPLCNAIPLPLVTDHLFCGEATASQLTAIGSGTNVLQWFVSLTAQTALTPETALTTGTYYVSQTQGECQSERATVNVLINPLPEAPVANAQSFCVAATVSQLNPAPAVGGEAITEGFERPIPGYLTGTHTFETGDWIMQNLGTSNTPGNSVSGYAAAFYSFSWLITPFHNRITSVTFFARTDGEKTLEVRKLVNGQEITLQSIALTTTMQQYTIPVNETNDNVKIKLFAQQNSVWAYVDNMVINFNDGATETISWYDNATSSTALLPAAALATGTYYVSRTLNDCESIRTEVTVNVNTTPVPVTAPIVICRYGTVANLTATGDNLKWYATATGGDALEETTVLEAGNYYVSQTLNDCESERVVAAVTINTTDIPLGAATQDYVDGESLADLDPSGENIVWYADADILNQLPVTTPLVNNTTYYAVQVVNDCQSLPLAVTVNEVLDNDKVLRSDFNYYPNPVKDILNISYLETVTLVSVYNSLGQEVLRSTFNNKNVQLNMASLSNGVYVINVVSGYKTVSFKVVK